MLFYFSVTSPAFACRRHAPNKFMSCFFQASVFLNVSCCQQAEMYTQALEIVVVLLVHNMVVGPLLWTECRVELTDLGLGWSGEEPEQGPLIITTEGSRGMVGGANWLALNTVKWPGGVSVNIFSPMIVCWYTWAEGMACRKCNSLPVCGRGRFCWKENWSQSCNICLVQLLLRAPPLTGF